MISRHVLSIATALFAFVGIACASMPFLASIGPSAAAGKDLPRLNVKELAPGSVAWFDNEQHAPYGERYLVVRFSDGAFSLFVFPLKNGLVGMPDIHWWRIYTWCKRLELKDPGLPIAPASVIRCKGEGEDEWWQAEWRWTLDGKNLGEYTDDLDRVRFVVEYGEVVVGKS